MQHAQNRSNTRDANTALDKKINMLRMQRSFLKQALNKKLRRAITEKLMGLFEHNYNQMQSSMPVGGYFDMIQANLLQPVTVTKNWTVPRLYKLYF